MATVYGTECCALAHLEASNGDSKERILNTILEFQRAEFYDTDDFPPTFFCVTLPTEDRLRENLKAAGFRYKLTLPRREELGKEKLKVYFLTLPRKEITRLKRKFRKEDEEVF